MENLIRGVNQECFEPCVFTTHVLVLGKGKTYSSDTASLLLKPTILAGATIPPRLVTSLLHAAFRQSVPSKIMFSITLHFVALYCNQQIRIQILIHLRIFKNTKQFLQHGGDIPKIPTVEARANFLLTIYFN